MPFHIIKSSGEKEPFSLRKLNRSLRKSGASKALIDEIIDNIKKMKPQSTQEIHDYAMGMLTQRARPVAAHYNLKQAILKLGPAGFPFEQFVAHILQAEGYEAKTNLILKGLCIPHEIDAVAIKNNKNYLVECKFHNSLALKTDVKVPLYIKARLDDIAQAEKKDPNRLVLNQAWIWSNTQFTTDAINYARCAGIWLTGWNHPEDHNSLPQLIEHHKLYPVTALTSINQQKKNLLVEYGLILCRDVAENRSLLKRLHLSPQEIEMVAKEADAICQLEPGDSD